MTNIFWRNPVVPVGTIRPQNVPTNAVVGPDNPGDAAIAFIDVNHLVSQEMESGRKYFDGTGPGWSWSGWDGSVDVDLKGPGYNIANMGLNGNAVYNSTGSGGQSLLWGAIRSGELTNGIPHELAFVAFGNILNRNAPGGRSFVWPNTQSDDPAIYIGVTVGNFYFGQLVAIPLSVDINSLGLHTSYAKNVARALQLYGGRATEGGNQGSALVLLGIYPDGASEYNLWNADPNFQNDYNTILANLRLVTNSFNPTNGGPPRNGVKLDGGDGTLSAPLAPSFNR